jgi:hypothetical protein
VRLREQHFSHEASTARAWSGSAISFSCGLRVGPFAGGPLLPCENPLMSSLGSSVALGIILAITAVGCGGSPKPGGASATTSATQKTSGSLTPTASVSCAALELKINVTIAGGHVSPTNESYTSLPDRPITICVDSDAADELYVQRPGSPTPDHKFTVAAAQRQGFTFVPAGWGRWIVDLHHLSVTVATIDVGWPGGAQTTRTLPTS